MSFAFAIPALFGTAGIALDFSRVQSARLSAQSTLDAALLASARQSQANADTVQTTIEAFFNRHGVNKFGSSINNLRSQIDGPTFVGSATVRTPTTLLNVVGFQYLDAAISSRVTRSTGNIEVALALDTTLSMQGTRLDNVKTAATQLVDMLYDLPEASSRVKVSVVPFAQYVNVGMDNRHASWMDVPPDTSTTQEVCGPTYPNATSSNCRIERFTTVIDGVPTSYDAQVCDWDYGTPVNVCSNVTTTQIWNGCAGSRSYPLNIRDEQYSSRIPGIRNVSCPNRIVPLSGQASDVRGAINGLTAQGDTYIPSGLVWGWRTLSNREPFAESANDPATAGGSVSKFLILMTDGFNTRSPRYPEGDNEGSDPIEANRLTRAACDNIKADTQSRIEIFTIAFEVTDEAVKDILRYCATPGGAFFDAVDYSRLLSAFGEIGNTMTIARLAR